MTREEISTYVYERTTANDTPPTTTRERTHGVRHPLVFFDAGSGHDYYL
jgi:hypothetical protein